MIVRVKSGHERTGEKQFKKNQWHWHQGGTEKRCRYGMADGSRTSEEGKNVLREVTPLCSKYRDPVSFTFFARSPLIDENALSEIIRHKHTPKK